MSSNKLEGIQVLRGYAAILVVINHLWSSGTISATLGLTGIGGLGVDIFFIISGFIMCYSLKERITPADSIEFLKKRIYRVYPIYLIVLLPFLLTYFRNGGGPTGPFDPMLAIGNILLMPSFFGGEHYGMLVGAAWTLCYELFFYVLFAAAMLSSTSKNRAIYTVMSVIVAMVTLVNVLGLKGPRLGWVNVQYMVGDTLFLNFVIGCVCYFTWRKYRRAVFSFWVAIGSALVLTVVAMALARSGFPRFISLGLPACATILIFLFAEFETSRLTRPLVFLGSASYSIYLVHTIVVHWHHRLIPASMQENDLTGIAMTVGAVAAGCLFYVMVENPIARVLHKPRARLVAA